MIISAKLVIIMNYGTVFIFYFRWIGVCLHYIDEMKKMSFIKIY
jgi:hypothetical protein